MKTISKIIKLIWNSVILPGCTIFTLLTMTTHGILMLDTDSKSAILPSASLMFLFLGFLISACTLIFKIKRLPLFLKIVANFSATLISIIAVLSFGSYTLDESSLVLIVLYTFLYIIIAFPALFISTRIKKHREEEDDYKSMFEE